MMFTPIEVYMQLSREQRRAHLDLSTACVKIGGYDSREYRGLLAHHLKTTIPTKTKPRVNLCHACHEHGCSNVLHLYWGTQTDNTIDAKAAGTWKSIAARTAARHDPDSLRKILSEAGRKGGKAKRKTLPSSSVGRATD